MATPFCAFKTLAGFGFQFTEVLSHFCELISMVFLAPNALETLNPKTILVFSTPAVLKIPELFLGLACLHQFIEIV
jgi:hypothetical protein